MRNHAYIGATASHNSTPCYRVDAWEKLVAAMERGDGAAIIAITTGTRPEMVPTAQLRDVKRNPPKTMAEAADDYWRKRREAAAKSPAALASGIVTPQPDNLTVLDPERKLRMRRRTAT